jgi:phospholipase/carboxylesterase
MPLDYELHIPPGAREGAPLIVLLHGRGSDRFDLIGLNRGLPAGAVIVTPEAPFPGLSWGYGPGWAWYQYLGEDRPEPESFNRSQEMLREFLEGISDKLPIRTGPLALGGFSQGGTMSLAHALRYPGTVPLVLNFSGFLAAHDSVAVTPETVAGTRIFWGHGTEDGAVPFGLALRGRATLEAAGAELAARDYRIAHSIVAAELADATAWLESGFAEARESGDDSGDGDDNGGGDDSGGGAT